MKAKHADQIRYGIQLARMSPDDKAGPLGSILLPRLTIKAYVREDLNVLHRILHPRQPETTDREKSTTPEPMSQARKGEPHGTR